MDATKRRRRRHGDPFAELMMICPLNPLRSVNQLNLLSLLSVCNLLIQFSCAIIRTV